MQHKSLWKILVLTVLFSLVLSACGGTPETTPEPTDAPDVPVGVRPLWTPAVKQAFAAAIDREVIVDRVFEGRNVPAYHMVPEGYPYATGYFRATLDAIRVQVEREVAQ